MDDTVEIIASTSAETTTRAIDVELEIAQLLDLVELGLEDIDKLDSLVAVAYNEVRWIDQSHVPLRGTRRLRVELVD